MTDIVVPHTVTAVGKHAFFECINVTDVYYTGSAEAWSAIAVGEGNDPLTAANLTTDYVTYVLGDADGNGKVNNRDLGLLQQFLNESDLTGKPFNESAVDMDGNGKLNNRDLGLLQRQLNQ